MNRYSSYKDSGVEWIGEIPSGWDVIMGSFIGSYSKGKGIKKDEVLDNGLPCIRYGEIYTKYEHSVLEPKSFISNETSLNSVSVSKGTLLLTGSGETTEEIGKCVVYLGDDDVWIGGDIIILQPSKGFDPIYLSYLINSESVRVQREMFGKGEIVVHIYSKNFKEMYFTSPSFQEQHQIVSYLDNKTSSIDSLIQSKEKKITLLKEKRTSLINQVVTKGLNPDVEMKDSGVEWIGEIPKEWDVKKLKYGVNLINEKGSPSNEDIKISPENVESDTGICFNLYSDYSGDGVRFISGDVLLNKLRIYLKKIILTHYEGYSMGEMIVLRCNEFLNNQYLFYLLFNQGLIDFLNSQSQGVKLPRVSPDMILNTGMIYPPLHEQHQIVEYLDKETKLIDETISSEQKKIELLKEYKQSLISEVVTGKRKVVN